MMMGQTLKRWLGMSLLLPGLQMLSACASSPSIEDYAKEQPVLSLSSYFNGNVHAQGFFTDRSGRVIKRFSVALKGTWNGPNGKVEEEFVYTDGTKDTRVWTLTETSPGKFEGRAHDVVGVAKGQSAGNAFNWTYTMALPVDGRVINVQFDDWMYLMDDRIMINKARMSKFGIYLGEVTLVFVKP
jgi:Protein of unknown function (DUF3833)